MNNISIIIVNWNSGKYLLNCVDSVIQYGLPYVDKVIVVDNNSCDGSDLFLVNIPQVTLIKAHENLGFAKACNLGAHSTQTEFLLFLNPDTCIFNDSLSKAVEFMKIPDNSSIGICGIRLLDNNGNTTISAARFPSLGIMAFKIIGLAALFPKFFKSHLLPPEELVQNSFVDQIIGAFFLVRRSVYDQCGGFDEGFFVYFEEVDFSLRAKQKGYSSYYLAEATASHKGGTCSEKAKPERLFYSLRSWIYYSKKHYSRFNQAITYLLIIIEFINRILLSFMRLSRKDFFTTIKAYQLLIKTIFFDRNLCP